MNANYTNSTSSILEEESDFQGISISNSFPVAGTVINEWGTTAEKGLFVAVLSGYVELSALFTMPVSGLIATRGETGALTSLGFLHNC